MKNLNIKTLGLSLLVGIFTLSMTSCKKKGCIDQNANNYNSSAKKDDGSCTYPVINVSNAGAGGASGDISGSGGSAMKTFTFTNNNTTVDWDMTINASSGSFRLVLKDASGAVKLDRTLTAGQGAQDAAGQTPAGTPGQWEATVTLTNFTGTGDYSFL